MAAFAELERHMIHRRTMAGLAAARGQGRVGGQPTVMDPHKLAAATARLARGESATRIAKHSGCPAQRSTATPTSSPNPIRADQRLFGRS